MSRWKLVRHTLRKIIDWSLTVKTGGAIIGLFWFLQWIRDEWLPQKWEERLRFINMIPHWHWYIWAILLLVVFLVGAFEGTHRWNKNEIAPILGWPKTLQNDAFLLARRVRDFIAEFQAANGAMPQTTSATSDAQERARMHTTLSDWCLRFNSSYRATLGDEVEGTLYKLEAEGIPLDVAGVLSQPVLIPTTVLFLAGQLMAGGLAHSFLQKKT